jgi:hypothetical protein
VDHLWHATARRSILAAVGALLLGTAGTAQADHSPRVAITVSTPGFYLSTGPRWVAYPYHDDYGHYYDCPPPHRGYAYYQPGRWVWQPPRNDGYGWRDDRRWRDDRGWRQDDRHDHGRHRGWDRRDDRRDDRAHHHDDDRDDDRNDRRGNRGYSSY